MNTKTTSEKNNGSSVTLALGNRAAFLANDPTARRVHELHMAEFRAKFAKLQTGNLGEVLALIRAHPDMDENTAARLLEDHLPARVMLKGIVIKAEEARQAGIELALWSDTLPGRRLTVDFYEQHKHELLDATGAPVRFDLLEWLIKTARENAQSPVETLHDALKYKQGFLGVCGQMELWENAAPPQRAVPPADPLVDLKKYLAPTVIPGMLARLRDNPNYYVGGQLRADIRQLWAAEFAPTFKAVDDFRRELGAA